MPVGLKFRVFFFLLCCSSTLFGQTGNYFISHHSPTEERFDYLCFDMAQDANGMMYFATKAGIVEFDGRDWDLLSVQSAVYSVKINATGEIFWAGAKGFGRIRIDEHGFQQIELLSDSSVSDVFQNLIIKDKAYFLSEEFLYVYDTQQKKTTVIKLDDPENSFLRLFELFGVAYTNTDQGTFHIEQNKLVASKINLTSEVIFNSRIDNVYVVGTADNKVYAVSEDLNFKPVVMQDQPYIDASVVISGSWLNRQLLALGTLRGGVIFINPINGRTQEIINYSTGLPDNEIFSLMTDQENNVWVSHDYGFSKISPFLPINSFSHYQGLQGNLLCAYSSQQTVYVGTSLGVFKLEKVDEYDELVYYVDVEIKEKKAPVKSSSRSNQSVAPPKKEEAKVEAPAKTESKKGGIFSFLRRNKNKDKEKPEPQATEAKKDSKKDNSRRENAKKDDKKDAPSTKPQVTQLLPAAKPKYRREKRVEKILRSSHYVFKKVQGIDAKINHLTEINGKLVASGLGGIYMLDNLNAKAILEEPVRYMFALERKGLLFVSTYNNDLRTMRFTDQGQQQLNHFSTLEDQVHYIFEGTGNELWLCSLEKIYRTTVTDSGAQVIQTIETFQQNSDKTIGVVYNDQVVLANTDGFFKFDNKQNQPVKIDSLPPPSQHFAHNGNILYRDRHGWKLLSDPGTQNNLQLLNIFDDLRFIAADKDPKNLWLISASNELYKFYSEKITNHDNSGFPLFLKSVINQDRKIAKRNEIRMDQESSSVRFQVVQPDYINPGAVEFRYFLKGMQAAGWSEWSSNNNVIDFPYLPTGEYTLQVESKNIFGKISQLDPVYFEVLPPYWKTSWFYAMEFAIFASLVVLSFRLSTRYRIVSRLLSLLTIILLIEFIQTAIGATITTRNSPVVDFFIQVVVALLVLPVEGYLRNLMLRSLDSSGKFYQFIVPKSAPPKIVTKDTAPPLVEETSNTK